jgi:alpha-tubulin suppressor-like RCC1 family protein
VPTLIQELSHHRVREAAVGKHNCAAVTEDGVLFMWANAASDGLFSEDEVGQPIPGLGLDGATIGNVLPPQCVTALNEHRVGSVAVGFSFTLVTTEAGVVFSFGNGERGMLGHGDCNDCIFPKRVEALNDVNVATVTAGAFQFLALTACGRVYWWGERITSTTEEEVQLLPQLIDSASFGGERVRSIAANFATAYAVTDAGVLFQWGCDTYAHEGEAPFRDENYQV